MKPFRMEPADRVRLEEMIRRRNSIDRESFEVMVKHLRVLRYIHEGGEWDVADVEADDDPWFLEARVYALVEAVEEISARRHVLPDLRRFARGQDCTMRLPTFCSHDPATTVLCHVRRGGVAGKGQKPCDLSGFIGCSRCHAVYDGQTHQRHYTRAELDALALEAVCRTHELYRKEWGWR